METTIFYDFDVTSGSGIQAEALFDIFDDLAAIVSSNRSFGSLTKERSNQIESRKSDKKGYP